jgi:phosphoadenosine phosphosulfate reductase
MSSTAINLYARATTGFDDRVAKALALLQAAAAAHPGAVVQTTSLGVEDMVVTDLIARHQLPISIATLNTGQLPTETLALIQLTQQRYGVRVQEWHPQADAVLHFVAQHGALAMRNSVALRQACCALRKLEPLARLLQGRTAWVTGLRRGQSAARADVPLLELDPQGRSKYSPLANWSQADVWHYVALHQVPYNPLHDQFFPSIGCAPCTRAVALGEDERAGRWWWENASAKECGLHVKPAAEELTPAVNRI